MTVYRLSNKPPRRARTPLAQAAPKPLGPVALERRARIEAMKTLGHAPARKGENEALA